MSVNAKALIAKGMSTGLSRAFQARVYVFIRENDQMACLEGHGVCPITAWTQNYPPFSPSPSPTCPHGRNAPRQLNVYIDSRPPSPRADCE